MMMMMSNASFSIIVTSCSLGIESMIDYGKSS